MNGRWHFAALSAAAGVVSARFDWRLSLALAALAFAFALFRKQRPAAVCAILFSLTSASFLHVNAVNKTALTPGTHSFIGKIASLPSLDGDQLTFQMKLPSGDIGQETIAVTAYLKDRLEVPHANQLRIGMICSLTGKLQQPALPRNFYAFNYRQYLFRSHIHWQLNVAAFQASSCHPVSYSAYDRLRHWRGSGISWIESHFPANIRGISEALIFGWRKNVSPDILQAYRNLGIIHLLAVSGLHVGLVVGALLFLLIRIGFTKERSLELLLAVLPIYILMTGASASVSRSGIMAILVLAALRFRRKLHPLDGISWAAIILLTLNPYLLFQVGFQLSFLVSFTLIASAPALQRRYTSHFAQILAVSVISQLIAMPILLFNFYGFSLFSLPFNLVFIPFISFFVLPLAFIGFFASFFAPFLAKPILALLAFAVRLAHGFLLAADHHFSGMLIFGKPSVTLVLLMYGAIFYGLLKWERGSRMRRLALPVIILVGLCIYQLALPYLSNEGEVTMLDVGQGDSILIRLPHSKGVYLIDTGGTIRFGQQAWQKKKHEFSVGRDVVLQELKARGIRKIDRLILTHGDRDHIGGANALLGQIAIGEIMYGKGKVDKPLPQEILQHAHQLGIQVVRVGRGMSWKSGNAVFTVLNPDGMETGNDRAVVIAAQIDGIRWLFTGDLEKEGEARILTEYPNLKIDILKAGHHGSDTSTTEAWLDALQPKVALISVGKHNLYHQPSPEVINRLRKHQIKVLRTDKRGAISFRFNGNDRRFVWVLKNN
ncbi:MAG TPA: DNA internalization-related competence protein ComEC/Rec2, partial [Bacillales bacterium]|nr:DNA internalization-related competence protein ComEC/Rec2 [Bacillales bacterium]